MMLSLNRIRYKLFIKMKSGFRGDSKIQLDDVVIEYNPILGHVEEGRKEATVAVEDCTNHETIEHTDNTPTPEVPLIENENTTENSTSIPNNSSIINNGTENAPQNQTQNEDIKITTISPIIDNNSTSEEDISNNNNNTEIVDEDSKHNITIDKVDNNSTEVGNATLDASRADEDNSLYGYAGEVVLIILTVVFLILFVGTAVKYHRLKTRF